MKFNNPLLLMLIAIAVSCAVAVAGTVTFVPLGPTTVPPGTPISYQIHVGVQTLIGFSTADLIIGSDDTNDVMFNYSTEWQAAFSNVTPIASDVGSFYFQSVFVGGNNGSNAGSVGTTLPVGIATIDTQALPEGTYVVRVDSNVDQGNSSLTFAGQQEFLQGSASFTIQCLAADGDCNGLVNLVDLNVMAGCLQGPGQTVALNCDQYDTNVDLHVDLKDFSMLANQFTGS